VKQLADQATPYVNKAKDLAVSYVDKAQASLNELRDKFNNHDIELTQADLNLDETLRDLAEAAQVEAEDFSDKAADKAKEVNENVDKAAEKVADKADDVK